MMIAPSRPRTLPVVTSAVMLLVGPAAAERTRSVAVSRGETLQPADPLRLALIGGGRRIRIPVTSDRADLGGENRREMKVLLQRGRLVVLVDAIGSRPQGLMRCQAGQETYARVIEVAARRERFAQLADSCIHDGIGWGSPPYSLGADGRTVTSHLLDGRERTIALADDGTFTVRP